MKQKKYLIQVALIFILQFVLLWSCKDQNVAPEFPTGENEFEQPEIRKFSYPEPEKVTWNNLKQNDIILSPKVKFDLDKLPSKPFDIGIPYTMTEPMTKEPFDWNELPSQDFDLETLPTQKLEVTTKVLGDPRIVKAGNPVINATVSRGVMNIDSNFGLPGLSNVVIPGKDGLIWFGTNNGIARYDGENLEIYGTEQGLDAISVSEMFIDSKDRLWVHSNKETISVIDFEANLIYEMSSSFNVNFRATMIEAQDGTFWYANWTNGYNILDFEEGTVKNFSVEHGLIDDFNINVFQDKEGLVWLSTNSGANIIDLKAGKNYFLSKDQGLLSKFVSDFFQDDNGDIWITGGGGVNILNKDKTEISYLKAENGLNGARGCSSVYKDKKGVYWLGTPNGLLFSFDKSKGLLRKYVLVGAGGNWVYNVFEDGQGEIWAAIAQNGLYKIDKSLGMPANLGTTQGLSSNSMWATLQDQKGRTWIGSRDGIDIYDPEENTIKHLGKSDGLFHDQNSRMRMDSQGLIWTAGIREGLSIIDPVNETIQNLTVREGILEGAFLATLDDANGTYWLGTDEGQILTLDLKSKVYKSIVMDSTDEGAGNNKFVIDAKNRIWIGTLNSGIEIYDTEKNTMMRLGTENGMISDRIYSMASTPENKIWVAAHEGVSMIDLERQEFTNFTTSQGLGANDVYAVIEKDKEVYLGTSNGLTILNPIGKKNEDHPYWDIRTLGQNQGLSLVDFAENSFSFDKNGRFWASLVESLTIIDPMPKDSSSYPTYITGVNILDKLRSFKDLKAIKERTGSIDSIWIREKNGFNILDKSKIDSGYLLQNDIVWETVKGPFDMPVGLQLPYTQNYLSFSYAGLQFSNPDKLVYRYILEGIDKNWSPISANSTSENYRDLPPGSYTFKVASKGFNGVWSPPAELSFTILPPWWQTWWAYGIFVILFLGLGVAILNYRSRWLKRENRILEEKVNERTSELKKTIHELENTQSQLIQSEKMASLGELTAGIAHEIQNPMNFINNFSEVTMELVEEMCEELDKLDKKETLEVRDISKDIVQNLEKITHHGKRASSIVRGMLEHSRNSSGQMEHIDINVLCDEYLRLAYHGLRAKDKSFNADFKTDFDQTLPKVKIMPQDLGRVVLNIINNAFFAVTSIPEEEQAADFKPLVTVSTKNMGDQVLISIRDNGPGIPQEIKDKIFQPFFTTKPTGKGTGLGLSLAYDIVTTGHGGAIELNTAPGEGTEFVIYIPIRE